MKNLNIIFALLLFPFLLLLRYSLTFKGNVHSKQKHGEQVKSKKSHRQFLTYIIPILFFTLLTTSPLSAIEGGVDCNNSVTVGTGTTSGSLVAADNHNDDYFKFITGGPGELQIDFNSTEAIKFYAGTTGCPISDYFLEIDPAKTVGLGLITLDANTTIYIHAERTNKNANYDFTINFTPPPPKPSIPTNICYDYAYAQDQTDFTEDNNGSFNPRIIGDNLNPGLPINVEIYVQNLDPLDDIENLTFNIYDIDTTQATYAYNSTSIKIGIEGVETHVGDNNASPTGSYNNDIFIGDINSREYFYVYYDIDPIDTSIDIPLNISLDYNVIYYYGLISQIEYQYEIPLDSSIPLCNNGNLNYTPAYGIFNMEDSVLTHKPNGVYGDNGFYNLPTQTANRVGDFVVAAYEANDVFKRKAVYTPVAVELIDAGKYGGTATSCGELDSTLGPRIWFVMGDESNPLNPIPTKRIDFNRATITTAIAGGQVSDQISGPTQAPIQTLNSAEELFSHVRENATFRLSYNGAGHGDLINLDPVLCHHNSTEICYNVLNFTEIIKYNGGNCIQDVDGQPTNIDKIPQFCNNAGTAAASAMTKEQLATCMECIYGFDINYLCARDNFAIRPESYRIKINDQNQDDKTQQSPIAFNDDLGTNQNRNHTSNTPYHVVAGYDYALEINATNHQNDNATLGYGVPPLHPVSFFLDGNDSKRSFRLIWQPFTDDEIYCNDIADHNKTIQFKEGQIPLNVRNQPQLDINSTQIGKYNLHIIDTLWTRVDWDPTLMIHHTSGQGAGYFLTGADCVEDTSYVPSETNIQTGINGINLANVSGCDITSNNHIVQSNIAARNGIKYKDIALRVHPYRFDLNGSNPIEPMIGPYSRTSSQTFVYIDTPPTTDADNTNMSYNLNGTFLPSGHPDYNGDVNLSNFVIGCYADDLNMSLNFTYNSPEPPATKAPYLSYSLKDHNTTDSNVVYRPIQPGNDFEEGNHTSSTDPFSITQGKAFFAKEMKGAITMDLGYNFVRDYNKTLNPRYIEFHDFNITYVDDGTKPTNVKADLESDFQIFGDRILDHNVTFVYGRAKPSQDFYDDVTASSIDTPISIVVYCDQDPITCSAVYNIDTVLGRTDEYNWYLLRDSTTKVDPTNDHVTTENDGNITLVVDGAAGTGYGIVNPDNPDVVNIENSGGVNNPDVNVTATGTTRPQDVYIDFGTKTNRWLIYNEDNNSIPIPFYRVHFIGKNDWAGHGDTGHVVDSNFSTKKNRRLGW